MTARCTQYMSALKILCKSKNQPMIAQESPHYNLITIQRWNYFQSILTNVITAPNSDLNVTDGQTDRHCGITVQ